MEGFLRLLKSEVLTEGLQRMGNNKPVALKTILSWMNINEPFIHFILTQKTNWYLSTEADDTAFIGWDPKEHGKLMLGIGPKCINSTKEQMAFVVAHEFAHFFRGHITNGVSQGKPNAKIANYAEDAIINDDIMKAGKFAGIPVKTPFPAITLKTQNFKGEEQNWLEGPKFVNAKYEGPNLSMGVYKWLIENWDKIKENQKKNNPDQGDGDQNQEQDNSSEGGGGSGGDSPPVFPEPGQIIFNKKTGQYGKVVTVHQAGQMVTKVTPMEKAAAEAEVIAQGKSLRGI